jgi:hypothetical protein
MNTLTHLTKLEDKVLFLNNKMVLNKRYLKRWVTKDINHKWIRYLWIRMTTKKEIMTSRTHCLNPITF